MKPHASQQCDDDTLGERAGPMLGDDSLRRQRVEWCGAVESGPKLDYFSAAAARYSAAVSGLPPGAAVVI